MAEREHQTLSFWRGHLPHWEIVDGIYFITIHIKGAIPQEGLDRIRNLSSSLESSINKDHFKIQRQIFKDMEHYLDNAERNAILHKPEIADILTNGIEYLEKENKWEMINYVIMPNHVHLFCKFNSPMKKLLINFKKWTARKIQKEIGQSGDFWQTEWFDHWSRSASEDEKIKLYIKQNPYKAKLLKTDEVWPYYWERESKK
ncbi:MAG: transposase [Lentisphaeria bacterium]|nr:transposase [Lentisphaeria bacterium]NQZ68184.1 transposase [Lentisphaeria bacterium]